MKLDFNQNGLSQHEVEKQEKKYGQNVFKEKKEQPFIIKMMKIMLEPMFILLLGAALVYFFLGEPIDGMIMLVFVVGIISMEIIQEWKTDRTLNALKDLSAPKSKVIREGQTIEIPSSHIVPGDLMLIEEGVKISADGWVVRENDLRVNESSLTGEAEAVWKKEAIKKEKSTEDYWRTDYVYTGTLVTFGSASILVDKTGESTEYGKIGSHLAETVSEPSPLDRQIGKLVKVSSLLAFLLFLLVIVVTYLNSTEIGFSNRLVESILSGITIAMAMIPEEFPVVLTIFLSMGAWRLARKQALVRKLSAVETMGAISVLAVDKTGTITENKMQVTEVQPFDEKYRDQLIETMGLACEVDPYDPMELAMLDYSEQNGYCKTQLFSGQLIKEYPFTDEKKMMGHVWQRQKQIQIAVKGSPESILRISDLTDEEKQMILKQNASMAVQGLRVIAVGQLVVTNEEEIPSEMKDLKVTFLGLIGLNDPPRKGIEKEIALCTQAGIKVVMITGDNGLTAQSIAKQIGIPNANHYLTGTDIDQMSPSELQQKVKSTNIFSRVTPEHKLKIIQAYKANNEVVAMTGDGVNDAPALKYADIGIAMGQRGSEVSREAADLILMDDNFSVIMNTVKDGRRIYANIKKTVGYIFAIHIPIALSALLGPLLGITQSSLFLLPLHVVLLELVIDPTCSIVLERQPSEPDSMKLPPRSMNENILSKKLIGKSLVQGFMIFLFSFGIYYSYLTIFQTPAAIARTMGLGVMIVANIFLVQVNSSNRLLAIQTFVKLSRDRVIWYVLGGTVFFLLLLIYSPFTSILGLAPLSLVELGVCLLLGGLSVIWYDGIRWVRNKKLYSKIVE